MSDFAQMYGHLPAAFQPHDFAERGARNKWRAAIHTLLPISPESLPPGLDLRRTPGNHYQPPRFNFGWSLSAQELHGLAALHGFLILKSPSPGSTTANFNSGDAGDFDLARMTKTLNQVLAASQRYTASVRIDILSTSSRHNRHSSIITDASSTSTSNIRNSQLVYCITLADNHHSGNQIPEKSSVEELQGFLGVDGTKPLGWYLDHKWSHWRWTSAEEILADERQHTKSNIDSKRP